MCAHTATCTRMNVYTHKKCNRILFSFICLSVYYLSISFSVYLIACLSSSSINVFVFILVDEPMTQFLFLLFSRFLSWVCVCGSHCSLDQHSFLQLSVSANTLGLDSGMADAVISGSLPFFSSLVSSISFISIFCIPPGMMGLSGFWDGHRLKLGVRVALGIFWVELPLFGLGIVWVTFVLLWEKYLRLLEGRKAYTCLVVVNILIRGHFVLLLWVGAA